MKRLIELVEDSDKRLSSSRTAYLLVTLVLSWLVISMELHGRTNEVIIGIFAAMGAGTYGMAKFSDNSVTKVKENKNVG